MFKSRRIRWTGHVVRRGEMENREISTDLITDERTITKKSCGVDRLARDRVQWRVPVNRVNSGVLD
jgi:hypothetical protein